MTRIYCLTAALLLACSSAPVAPVAAVPANLAVPEGQALVLRALARGVQIYACKPAQADASAFEWVLKAPEAELFDASGGAIGHHFGGPTWQNTDGSSVVGEVLQRAPAQGTIPWLLLRAKSTQGAGVLAQVSYIQRVETAGGTAPATGCDAAHAGAEARVDYTASYVFYGPR